MEPVISRTWELNTSKRSDRTNVSDTRRMTPLPKMSAAPLPRIEAPMIQPVIPKPVLSQPVVPRPVLPQPVHPNSARPDWSRLDQARVPSLSHPVTDQAATPIDRPRLILKPELRTGGEPGVNPSPRGRRPPLEWQVVC